MGPSTQSTCRACNAAVTSTEDRFCGECGAPLDGEQAQPVTSEHGTIPSAREQSVPIGAPLALAAAVRVQAQPRWSETPGTLLAEDATLAFFSKDPRATLIAPLARIADYSLTRIGPVDALQFRTEKTKHCFLLKDGAEFYEMFAEMVAQQPQFKSTPRLRTLSEGFAERAPDIVRDGFTVEGLFQSAEAAQSFIRLVGLVTKW